MVNVCSYSDIRVAWFRLSLGWLTRICSVLPATSRLTFSGSIPGSGTSMCQPSSVVFTRKELGDSVVRAGRSFQNWLNTRSTSRWKLNTSSNGLQRLTLAIETSFE